MTKIAYIIDITCSLGEANSASNIYRKESNIIKKPNVIAHGAILLIWNRFIVIKTAITKDANSLKTHMITSAVLDGENF